MCFAQMQLGFFFSGSVLVCGFLLIFFSMKNQVGVLQHLLENGGRERN